MKLECLFIKLTRKLLWTAMFLMIANVHANDDKEIIGVVFKGFIIQSTQALDKDNLVAGFPKKFKSIEWELESLDPLSIHNSSKS